MKLLYLTHTTTWKGGGIFFTAYHLGRHMVSRGHEVTLVTISPIAKWGLSVHDHSGIRIIETPDLLWGIGRSGWDPWDLIWRIGFLQKGRYDLAHCFESRPLVSIPGVWARKKWGIPLVFTWADWFGRGGKGSERGRLFGSIADPVETFFEEYFYRLGDTCLTMGEPLTQRAAALGIKKEKLFNILHGCDTEHIKPQSISEARSILNTFQKNESILGYLGVLRPSNADLLFTAFQEIRMKVSQRCRLVLIGNHKLDLRKFIPQDCKNDVIETGWLAYDEVSSYLAACDLLLLPLKRTVSSENVWPSKCNDYLSSGRPIVATSMKSLSPLFNTSQIGVLTEDTPQAFTKGCIQLLEDEQLREIMGKNSRQIAETILSWPIIGNRVEDIYIQCGNR